MLKPIAIDRPMDISDLMNAANQATSIGLALSDLHRAVAAFEAATGLAIAVVDASKAVTMIGVDLASGPDETMVQSIGELMHRHSVMFDREAAQERNKMFRDAMQRGQRAVAGDPPGSIAAGASEASLDAELLNAMYPSPIPEAGTVEDAVKAGAQAVAELVSEPAPRAEIFVNGVIKAMSAPQPASIVQKMQNALPSWHGKTVSEDLRDAVQHIATLSTGGTKWGLEQDLDMIERAIDGQSEKLIADVMEFSQSYIRQRFNKLVDRTHGQGNRFTREQVREALRWMLFKETAAF